MNRVEAKVAAVLSDQLLALNVGSNDGIVDGLTVRLYKTATIRDPDSNENLGMVSISKLNLRINHVQSKLCVAGVEDFQEPRPGEVLRVRRRKKVTEDVSEEGSGVVYVSIGERAVIEIPEDDEPPF